MPKIVEVTWRDACLRMSSMSFKKARRAKPVVRRTVGHLVKLGKKKIVLAVTFDEAEGGDKAHFDDVYVIPADWMIDVRYLS